MHWYVIHTKPRQEKSALRNLEQQGYACYLPVFPSEKLRHGVLAIADEPLFPRYLFIRLDLGVSAKSWSPIRSTRGVNRLVCFGNEPTRVDERLIALLRSREHSLNRQPQQLFTPGERVQVNDGAFAGIEGVYQMADSENRAMLLIELLSKPTAIRLPLSGISKIP